MPSISLYPPHQPATEGHAATPNPLPKLLQTPVGLAIIEVQGSINLPSTEGIDSNETLSSETSIGRLVFPNLESGSGGKVEDNHWMKVVYLYVGRHQRLTGEVKKLPKPLAVMRRKVTEQDDVPRGTDIETEDLEILEIVYYKIIFSSRPEPVGD